MPRLAIINDYLELAASSADWGRLPDHITVEISHDRLVDRDEAAQRLRECSIIVTAREETRFDRWLVGRLPELRLLVTHGMRNAALDLAALGEHGVTVCGTGYGFPMATVELAWGLILSLAKRIPGEDRAIRSGGFGQHLPIGLTGKTIGIVGLGELGSGVARVAQAFDMNVIAWSQNLTPARCRALGVRYVSCGELFETADVVSVHLQLSDRTRGIIGADAIGRMKSTAFLVNTARGPIVDEAALVHALENNAIAGAGLDVYDVEPLPLDHPLRSLPNTVLTPHVGGRTEDNVRARYADCLDDVEAWLRGAAVRVLASPAG
jgi:phosphoglycerate dehydrogenase-like enzyme